MFSNYIDIERLNQVVENFETVNEIKVIGDSGLDCYTFGNVERISPEAPVPVLRMTRRENRLGMATNVSLNLSEISVKNSLYSIVGDDSDGDILLGQLNKLRVGTENTIRTNYPTIRKERVLTETQQICRIDQEPSCFNHLLEHSEKLVSSLGENANAGDFVILSDYSKGSLSEGSIQNLIDASIQKQFFVTVDPGKGKSAKVFKNAFLLKPNLKEAEFLVSSLGHNETSPEKMATILLKELNIKNLVITLGKEGVAIADQHGTFEIIPTFAQEVFDVCGAGDTFMSLLVASLSAGGTLQESAIIANCGASVVVSKKGTATVDKNELKNFFGKLNQHGIKNERSDQRYFERL